MTEESGVTELDVFGCDWNEWASGIAETEFIRVAANLGKRELAEALAMVTVLVITEAQRLVAEGKLKQSVQMLNCLKKLIVDPDEFFSKVVIAEATSGDQSVKH